jgi:hypothetical protein
MNLEHAPAPGCAHCRHFDAVERELESKLRNLSSLSSAYGSVRAHDGLCHHHDRYVAVSSICAAYLARAALQPA